MTTAKPSDSEFRRGWPIVLAAGLGIGCGISPVPFNVVGHLVIPLQAEFGWSRGQILFAVTLLGATVTLLSPLFGALVDRVGVRAVALWSTLGFAIGWALIAATPASLLAFYALWVLMAVIGGASIPVCWTRAVAGWFNRRRGLALALALSSTGMTAAVINVAAPLLIAAGGWRLAVLGTAALPLLVSLPIAFLFFRAAPIPVATTDRGASDATDPIGATLHESLRDHRFWLMFTGLGLIALAYGGLYANFVPLLIDGGFAPVAAGGMAGTLGLSIVAGRILVGMLLDRFWAPLVALPCFLAPAVACLLLAEDGISSGEALASAVLLGLAAGAETDLISFLTARYFGLTNYGRIYGVLYMAFGLGSAVAAPLFGWSFDVTGSYRLALQIASALFVAGAVALMFIGRYPETRQ